MNRRTLLIGSIAATSAFVFGGARGGAMGTFEIERTDAQWRARLGKTAYKVMRKEGTERAGSSPLDKNYSAGTYVCNGCDLPVYSSEHKFDSGTGWPSFYQSLPGAVGKKQDRKLFTLRTEVHCRRCGSHFGHIFDDGPQPTGERHCLNGVSLKFQAA